jgi:HSP20 family protein
MTTIRLFHPSVVNRANQSLSAWSDVLEKFFENDNRLDHGHCNAPKTNIIEKDDSYRIDIYVPGISKSDIKLEVEKDVLTISKSEKQEAEDGGTYRLREFDCNSFERRFTLSDDVNVENIKADYNNGILSVTLTKKEEVKPIKRAISIE